MLNLARRWMLYAFLCLAFGAISAQQPGGLQLPRPQLPDENAPGKAQHHPKLSTKEVGEKLRKGLDNKKAAYAGSKIQAAVDDQSVILTGTVKSQTQHEMALQLAQAYADDRKIIDRLVVQQ